MSGRNLYAVRVCNGDSEGNRSPRCMALEIAFWVISVGDHVAACYRAVDYEWSVKCLIESGSRPG
jgi:hypothetical protein